MATADDFAHSTAQTTKEEKQRSRKAVGDAMEEHAEQLYVGVRVKVFGLARETQFNGAHGEVAGHVQTQRELRVAVKCDGGDRLCLRREHLQLLGTEWGGGVYSI